MLHFFSTHQRGSGLLAPFINWYSSYCNITPTGDEALSSQDPGHIVSVAVPWKMIEESYASAFNANEENVL